jgi:Kdo2-lipid IVA lauroyltransferase/acyltransferase
MPKFKHIAEAAVAAFISRAFIVMPLDMASYVAGWMARSAGPYLGVQKTAHKNLSMVFPKLDKQQRNKILNAMWDNLGRVTAELVHLSKDNLSNRMLLRGAENIPEPGKPVFFFSGHYGNWELLPILAAMHNRPLTVAYRMSNNALVDDMVSKIRSKHVANMFPKGHKGAVKMVRAIKNNEAIAMLVDQKHNDGIAVPFFGHDAMTAPAIAELALRYDIPIIPARVVRGKGVHFNATVYPALSYTKTGDRQKDVMTILTLINQTMEGWIREHPSQWFWVHKRWPNS